MAVSHSPSDLLDAALEAIDREYRRTAAERTAFREFLDTVGDLSPTAATTATGLTPVQTTASQADSLRAIRDAYESTVMDVSHYETEYDEPYAKSVTEELGPDIATLLTSGQVFEQHHKHAVLTAAEEATERRGELLDALIEERQSVVELREPVCSVEADIDGLETVDFDGEPRDMLDGYRRRLDVLEERCHELVDTRQSGVVGKRRALALPIGGPDLPTYLYQELPVNYPIIAVLTELIERAATSRAAVEAELTAVPDDATA